MPNLAIECYAASHFLLPSAHLISCLLASHVADILHAAYTYEREMDELRAALCTWSDPRIPENLDPMRGHTSVATETFGAGSYMLVRHREVRAAKIG